ncbi:hypothetical protein M662_03330 [Bacillus sp. SB49]|uniref:hypothetical protein n=1 Tax=Bacillus sp. SB49 TaxID=1071080 RepID=UPI00047B308F|nr:hypothetical protein [Bacillus sp. SB49]QHT45582.1 hypothetical protein M662_03330 [Bacillus sp. SB49]
MKQHERKGIHKQYLLNKNKTPPSEAKERAEEMRLNEVELHVFNSSSELDGNTGVFGLGVSYVGQSQVITKSRKFYFPTQKGKIQQVMVQSMIFSLIKLEDILLCKIIKPKIVNIYSTLESNGIDVLGHHPLYLSNNVQYINQLFNKLNRDFHDISFHHMQLDKGLRTYNPFFKAANNAARNIIQK